MCYSISGCELKQWIDSQTPVTILDVRSYSEYACGHIPYSINISLADLNCISQIVTNPQCPIVVYCQTGMRSRQATEYLCQMGYTNVYLLGGLQNWQYELVC